MSADTWVTVPREPTKKMLHAAAKALSPGRRPTADWVSVKEKHAIRYRAMIEAVEGDSMPLTGSVTPHDISQLAETRRRDPDLAMRLAEQSGKESDRLTRTSTGFTEAHTKEKSHGTASR